MRFFAILPEAAGQMGNNCIHGEITARPVEIIQADFEFQFWPHDDLLCGFYIFACSASLAEALVTSGLNGFELAKLDVSFEERFYQWAELHKGEQLPEYQWLKIVGRAGIEDFGLVQGQTELPLVVSERALTLLKQFKLQHCDIETYSGQKLSAAG